jgi:hypothetical protein
VNWPPNLTCRPIDQWPSDFTKRRVPAPFRASWSTTISGLARELRHLEAKNPVLMVELRERDIRLDGMPRSGARPDHPGVILAFDSKHGPLKYPCDTYTDWQDNLRAIVLAMDALRRVDRYGVTSRGEQYTGWKALPAGRGDASSGMTTTAAAEILMRAGGLSPGGGAHDRAWWANFGAGVVRSARAATHPDRHNGDTAQWHLVDNAEQTLRQAGWLPKAVTS